MTTTIYLLFAASLIINAVLIYKWSDETFLTSSTVQCVPQLLAREKEKDVENKVLTEREEKTIAAKEILIFRSFHNGSVYAPARDSVHCFAKIAGYQLLDVDLDKDHFAQTMCAKFKDKNFQRHCVLAEYLKERKNVSYALTLDGDILVINPWNSIEKFIDPSVDVMFPRRFRTMEIAACSFIVKNSDFGRRFLIDWARYYFKLPNVGFSNSDNGALLAIAMKQFSVANHEYATCVKLWEKSETKTAYMRYMHCVSVYLGARRKEPNDKIKILRRGHSWIRDFSYSRGYWCKFDFFFHNVKSQNYGLNSTVTYSWLPYAKPISIEQCKYGQKGSGFVMRDEFKVSCGNLRKSLAENINDFPVPELNDGSDVECWPHCDDEN